MVLLIMLCEKVITFESGDEILKCNHSVEDIEQYVPSVYFVV